LSVNLRFGFNLLAKDFYGTISKYWAGIHARRIRKARKTISDTTHVERECYSYLPVTQFDNSDTDLSELFIFMRVI
jgi:hypothetical protein